MRKLVFVGLLLAGTMLASVGTSHTASASWCYRGYGYAAPVYGFGYSPWLYRSYYRPRFFMALPSIVRAFGPGAVGVGAVAAGAGAAGGAGAGAADAGAGAAGDGRPGPRPA